MHTDKAKDLEIESLRHEIQFLKQEIEFLRTHAAPAEPVSEAEAVQTSNRELRLAVDCMDVPIVQAALSGEVLYGNRKFCREFHVDGGHISEMMIYDLFPSIGDREGFGRMVEKMRSNGGATSYHVSRVLPPQNIRETFKVNAFIANEPGAEEKIWFFAQDISDIARSRDEFYQLNTLFDAILSNIPVFLFVKDVENDLRYLYWNRAFVEHSKIPASKAIGHTDFEIFPVYEDAQKFRNDDIEVIRTGVPLDRQETYQAADGTTRIVQTLKTLVPRMGRGPLLVGVGWDVTNMQKIEQELVQERLRAEQSDRLKSLFLANMSHEIRTPLNAIVGFSQLLATCDNPEDKKLYSSIMEQNSEMLLNLINDILDISKIEAGTLEYNRTRHDLREVFTTELQTLKSRAKAGVPLVFDDNYPGQPLIINEDPRRITQVLTNYITNAMKFTAQGSIHFGYRLDPDCIVCYVRDTGVGIPAAKIATIFDRFVKLNKFEQGTGLGLSICQVIANAMGGRVWVESVEGQGSTFYFSIPYSLDCQYNQPLQPKAEDVTADKQIEKTGAKILVAEDVQSNFQLLRALIGKKHNLLWAKDGMEALKMWQDENPDLILMDVKMPELDGLEATRRIRATGSQVPIIALTAFAFPADQQKALDAGANEYLTKPLDRAALSAALSRLLP